MKYSILGFNQEKIVNYSKDGVKCDLTDLLLLNYIVYAQANPKMKHILDEENQPCVWLQHAHILEDLPILGISEGTLKNRLTKLRRMELITSKTIANENTRGSRTYYRTTSFLYDMLFDTTSLKNDVKDEPRHDKMTSNTSSNSNNKVNKELLSKDNNSTNFSFGKKQTKPKKENLFSKCVSQIDNFTDDTELRNTLIDYLRVRLEMKDKPLYANSWKGLLNKLDREFDASERLAVVRQSIERGYASFFPVSNGYSRNRDMRQAENMNYSVPHMTEEDYAEEEKLRAELEKKGVRTVF